MSGLRMLLWIFLAAIAVVVIAVLLYFQFSPRVGSDPAGTRLERIQSSPNYRDGKFQNVLETNMDMPFSTMAKIAWQFIKGGEGRETKDTIPTVAFDRKAWEAVPDSSYALAWFGHSSLLIKLNGITLLCDPVFGERASTFSFMGPKRFTYDRYMSVDQLPHVDVVLLSHDHYDHLDRETVLQLKDKVERWVMPLGVGAHLEAWGVAADRISEHDWWESLDLAGLRLALAPSRHFSGRGLSNRYSTLWGSWVLEGGGKRIYFGADSGPSSTFAELGQRFGSFDLVLLECGAYNVAWAEIHMRPEESAQAAKDMGAEVFMPIHWAKFSLAMHTWKEPVELVSEAAHSLGLPLLTPRVGRIVVDADLASSERWWDEVAH